MISRNGCSLILRRDSHNKVTPISNEPNKAIGYNFAPDAIPAARAQNIYTISRGSFTAFRNLTMLKAPTIPSESTIFVLIVMMTNAVIIVIRTKDTL
ncbi:hypothetical protein D3C73_1535430 [compost metagenome]